MSNASLPRAALATPSPRTLLPGPLRRLLPYLGPGFLVCVGYVDPGNWATDLEAGASFGYSLLWVLVASNVMAILLQTVSAKLGLVTGLTYPENCRRHFSRRTSLFLWLTAEAAAMATDLAEFLGAALGFYLLLHIPLFPAALIAAVVVFLILGLYRYGYRPVEYVILALVAVIGFAYVIEVTLVGAEWGALARGVAIPQLHSDSILIAMGMLGATVMPHNIYLHSGVIQSRRTLNEENNGVHRRVFRLAIVDSVLALNMAWLINSAIVVMAAGAFFRVGVEVTSIEQAHQTLTPLVGGLSSTVFAIALLASGLSSSTTATLAGQIIIEGFLNLRIGLFLRRAVTVIPALIVIATGLDSYWVLIISQVSLSMQLPFAIFPLIALTARRDIMGEYANGWLTNVLLIGVGMIISLLNVLLLWRIFGGPFPW